MPPRIFPGDEELGKRDDDHKPGKPSPLTNVLMHSRLPQRRNIKRLGILFAILVGLYYFFKNMPTDLRQTSRMPDYRYRSDGELPSWTRQVEEGNSEAQTGKTASPPTGASVEAANEAGMERHWFNGPIKFYKLAASLHAISRNGGGFENQNVLFAASSLKSTSVLLPMACEMSILKRNTVHFAFLGRDEIPLSTLREVNGVESGCEIYYHDARPDYSVQSSDYRMEVSDGAALVHINNFMHPTSIIIDGSNTEDGFFVKSFRKRAASLEKTLIELPKNSEQSLMWITRLDSSSLSAWNRVKVDILIHAQSAASGSLLRLLSSLSKADYFSSTVPGLTIELPRTIDLPTQEFLKDFKWPPASHSPIEGNDNRLTLRHRVSQYGLTPEESSVRFLESFWPANSRNSHVLILSPQVELSPLFFHYLKYILLEYKYGAAPSNVLMGISLDLPSTYLNDTSYFFPPFLKDSPVPGSTESTAPFFWQAPNSNAALYFGDHWTELHSFISLSLASKHKLSTPTTLNKKLVSKTYPSWLEQVLSLCRVRGYGFLYPNLANQTALATVHNELYHPLEEFNSESGDLPSKYTDSEDDWTVDPVQISLQHEEKPLARTSLLNFLPSDPILASIQSIPHLTWEGNEVLDLYEMQTLAEAYAEIFKREIGGCVVGDDFKLKVEGSADDLFCISQREDTNSMKDKLIPEIVTQGTPEPVMELSVGIIGEDAPDKSIPIVEEVKHPLAAPTDITPVDTLAVGGSGQPSSLSKGTTLQKTAQIADMPSLDVSEFDASQKSAPKVEVVSTPSVEETAAALEDAPNKRAQIVEDAEDLEEQKLDKKV